MLTAGTALLAGLLLGDTTAPALAVERAAVAEQKGAWTVQNEALQARISFSTGSLVLTGLRNRLAGKEYLEKSASTPLFSFIVNGHLIAANDGGWTLESAKASEIALYGTNWGKQLELKLTRRQPVAMSLRQIFEIYDGQAGLHCYARLKNETEGELALAASDVLSLSMVDRPHTLHYIEGALNWEQTQAGLTNGGRNTIVEYRSGDGWFVVPENNWATSLEPGPATATSTDKLLGLYVWNGDSRVRVATNPRAVQLVLFPHEELDYFGVDLGVFQGDGWDGRLAVAAHLRERFKFHDPSRFLSLNDWQWGAHRRKRTDADYRKIVLPRAKAAGFDRIHIDDYWYEPEDGTAPKQHWTDMPALCDLILCNGMKPGHWFSLQGRICIHGWAEGRDCADPANVDFKLQQLREVLIGQYHTAWDQVDAGLLWKTGTNTSYSHPGDSVYRKILGMRRYMNTIAHEYPDFIMQTTCEVDNPAGPGGAASRGNQNVGLIHLADNGIAGMYCRTEYGDNVRDLLAAVGMFPTEGLLATWGEDSKTSWKESPLWYYQFLLARHSSVYSWPGDWSAQGMAGLRRFNDWRNNPRIKSVLNELVRPVYNGPDWRKNEGPWAWMFTDPSQGRALLVALNHLNLNPQNAFAAKLRWLDSRKTYLVEDITQTPDGQFAYSFRGQFSGKQLQTAGLPVNLDSGAERCAAYWIQELTSRKPQVLYADAAVTSYDAAWTAGHLTVTVTGQPHATARLFIFKPAAGGVEERVVTLDAQGRGTARFDGTTIAQTGSSTSQRAVVRPEGSVNAPKL